MVWWLPDVGVNTQLPLSSLNVCSVFLHRISLPENNHSLRPSQTVIRCDWDLKLKELKKENKLSYLRRTDKQSWLGEKLMRSEIMKFFFHRQLTLYPSKCTPQQEVCITTVKRNKGMYKGSHRLESCWGPILWPMIR